MPKFPFPLMLFCILLFWSVEGRSEESLSALQYDFHPIHLF